MDIKKITVSASLSRNYQTARYEIEAEILNEDEREFLKSEAVKQASSLLDQIEAELNSKNTVQPVVQPQSRQQSYYPKTNYRAPAQPSYQPSYDEPNMMAPRNNAGYNTELPPSTKQLDYLAKLGYHGATPRTRGECDELLKRLKGQSR